MNCLLCCSGNIEYKFTFSGKDIYLKKLNIENFDLKWYECERCGVYFSNQYKHIESIYEDDDLYDAAYDSVQIETRFEKIMSLDEKKSDNINRVNRLKNYHQEYLKLFSIVKDKFDILDIGAGLGVFLAKFLDDNFNGYALELNKVALRHISNVLPKVNVYQDFMQNLNFHEKFDLISMNRVLEHISDPVFVLHEVKKALKIGGLLYLELPDTLSYELNGDSNEAFASGHYMVYSSRSINYLFEKVGLELMSLSRVQEPSGKFTVYAIGRKDNEVL